MVTRNNLREECVLKAPTCSSYLLKEHLIVYQSASPTCPISVVVTSMSASAGVATSTMRALSDSRGMQQLSRSNTFHLMNNIEHEHPTIVSQDEWLVARKAHLEREKALTRLRDQVSAERRELPWVKIEKNRRTTSSIPVTASKRSITYSTDGVN